MTNQGKKPAGTLYIVSAPSGTGKTSLVVALINKIANVKLSVSYTTRARRSGETDGVDYNFVADDLFEKMVQKNEFLEYATVFSSSYGTVKHNVETHLYDGFDVILEIDWQGAKQICAQFPNTVTIFILPPSKEALRKRIQDRNQNLPDDIDQRLQSATHEVMHYSDYDYLIVNDKFEVALLDLETIFRAERFRVKHQKHPLKELIRALQS